MNGALDITGRRRGQPAIALVALLGCWIAARAAMLGAGTTETDVVEASAIVASESPDSADKFTSAVPMSEENREPKGVTVVLDHAWQGQSSLPTTHFLAGSLPIAHREPHETFSPNASTRLNPDMQLQMERQLFRVQDIAQVLVASEVEAVSPGIARRDTSRWSGDAWLLLRHDAVGTGAGVFAGLSYGASQVGAVLRYRLAPGSRYQPQVYLRGSTALNDPRESELAFGLALRPLAAIPATVLAEGRATRSGGRTRLRPTIAVVSALPRLGLPHGLRSEAYVQGGYVGGSDATGFVDGQARLDHGLLRVGRAELRGGGAMWGGAQRGAGRLDLGPSVTLEFPLGTTNARLAADWRFRTLGQAAPSSGPALTLSAGF